MSTSDQSKTRDRRDNPYNGYSNFDTWTIALWRYNLPSYQTKYESLVNRVAGTLAPKLGFEEGWQEVRVLYRDVWEQAAKRDGCRWLKVDWEQLKKIFSDHVEGL